MVRLHPVARSPARGAGGLMTPHAGVMYAHHPDDEYPSGSACVVRVTALMSGTTLIVALTAPLKGGGGGGGGARCTPQRVWPHPECGGAKHRLKGETCNPGERELHPDEIPHPMKFAPPRRR
uniref:Uncharacterized protein n=1 Tax=Knipowitschia caucasica TaxID=637954 RepID=A0AAV2KWA9_KNICA